MSIKNKTEPFSFYKGLFLPLVAMLGLVGISTVLFNSAADFFINETSRQSVVFSLTGFIPLLALVFIFSRRPIRSWLSPLIALFVVGQLVMALLLLGDIPLKGPATIFLARLLNPSIFAIFIWGFANQVTRLSEGMQYYIPLAFFSGLFLLPFSFFEKISSVDQATIFLFSSAACLAATWMIYRSTCKKVPEGRWTEETKETEPSKTSYIFRFAFAFAAFGLMRGLLDPLFKSAIAASPYTVGNYAPILGVGVAAFSTLCLFVGPWLLKRTGWLLTALTPSLIATQFMALFYVFFTAHLFAYEFMALNEMVLKTLHAALLLPLLQIGYLSLPKSDRFHTKTWSEIIFCPFIVGSSSIVVHFLIAAFGTVDNILPYLTPLSIGVAILVAFFLGPIGKRKALLPQPASIKR